MNAHEAFFAKSMLGSSPMVPQHRPLGARAGLGSSPLLGGAGRHRGLGSVGTKAAKVDSSLRSALITPGRRAGHLTPKAGVHKPAKLEHAMTKGPGRYTGEANKIDDLMGLVAPVSPKQATMTDAFEGGTKLAESAARHTGVGEHVTHALGAIAPVAHHLIFKSEHVGVGTPPKPDKFGYFRPAQHKRTLPGMKIARKGAERPVRLLVGGALALAGAKMLLRKDVSGHDAFEVWS